MVSSPRKNKRRLDQLLVERGLAPSRERAQALVLAGKVLIGERVVDKAGLQVAEDAELRLREPDHPWASRGGLKLVKAVETFALGHELSDAVCADIGASTGGFTDVLLTGGARRVFAIDVGQGQLAWKLASDPRVVVMDKTNVRNLESLPERPTVVVIDVSFISLTLVLPRVVVLAQGARLVALVKPQFEVGPAEVGKGGVVRDVAARQGAVDKVTAFARAAGFVVDGVVESPITGPAGNVEYLLVGRVPA
ncbi:MAG: TlyA family RNA methyltransferase [Deltaproteobacteria bacterium]|nr:TlyA family RNA methyltransferase [Deltaproteobacteria bacterium]